MSSFSDLMARLRGLDLERAVGLRPPYPPVALELDGNEVSLVRLKKRRGQKPLLEAFHSCTVSDDCIPSSIFQTVSGSAEGLTAQLRGLFEQSGTRPGRVSLILPDNLAKITMLALPERPASRRQLDELVLAKMRRAVPFRIEEARLAYEVFPGEKREIVVLVVLVRRSFLERFEQALLACGARPGLIDISTPNLINLSRANLSEACEHGDAALLNCSRNYFSLVVVRDERLIFFRCKTFVVENDADHVSSGVLDREFASSFAYYRDKLDGQGVGTVFVRSVATPFSEIAERLRALGCDRVEAVTPTDHLEIASGLSFDESTAQRISPALAAAVGRG